MDEKQKNITWLKICNSYFNKKSELEITPQQMHMKYYSLKSKAKEQRLCFVLHLTQEDLRTLYGCYN
jgi:hypothetical protein